MTAKEQAEGDLTLLTALPQVHRLVMSSADLHAFGFTKSQFLIFAALAHRHTLNMTQVAEYLSSPREQATRAVAQLVDGGYLVRQHDAGNRTHVYIRLSDKGQALMERWRADFCAQLDQKLNTRLTSDDRMELNDSLRSVLRILDKVV